ncbi:MAG: antitoxin HicB [Actinomyces sp.]|jgi:DNA-directed RNA polymerase specialized sigma24 family protein|nr:antitoxin HicB [Actinomyces sp.]MCI1641632.1 antitoxin HicB [Actinomyces sp.]MCI1787535.1 antitoxin HicB [Actinomyces sp.]MCI1829195.1 antitoxin HicB [Actinomyces sp.]MCI1865953.1 antitoxin HicB [Actinomyces sp.]
MSKTIRITAKRWAGGWELWNGDDVWTQVDVLSRARQQVVDYLDTVEDGIEHSGWDIEITPEVDGVDEALRAREAVRAAETARREAARLSSEAARRLRSNGLSLADTADIMGVSRGRVSQLVKAK